MAFTERVRRAGMTGLCAAILGLPAVALGGNSAIESGQYLSDWVYFTNAPVRPYYFYATNQETVIVRVANEDYYMSLVPDVSISTWPADAFITSVSNKYTVHDITLTNLTTSGWFKVECRWPAQLVTNWWYYTFLDYSISMLRMPNAPLSYADPEIGNIGSGESLPGTIHVGADLDAAFVAVTNPCRIILRMGQESVFLVPFIRLYDPYGNIIALDFPPEYRSEVTAFLTATGRYTVVYNDFFNARGQYYASLAAIPGAIAASDQDFGPILNGETRTGTINHPGDLDVATFAALVGDTNVLTMTKIDTDMNPRMELYDPSGSNRLAAPQDPFQISVSITNVCATAGTYYVICKDAEDRYDKRYTLFMTTLGGPSSLLSPTNAPAKIEASDGLYTNLITITWDPVTNIAKYDLSCGTNALAEDAWVANSITGTSYQDYTATPNRVYYYKVKARNDYGTGPFSSNDSGYCGAAPDAPSVLTASDGTYSNHIFVSWPPVTNAASYDVWRTVSTDNTVYVELATNYMTTPLNGLVYYQDSDVVLNLVYHYKVKSRNICGTSDFSTNDSGYCGLAGATTNRRALLVGIDAYSYGPSPLSTCTNDANGLREIMLLGDPSNRWKAANITTLLDAQATKSAIRTGLRALAAQSGAGDLVLFGHSSHGGYAASLSNTYICTYDANYSDTELASDLTFFRPDARVIIIIDACYSGGMYKLDAAGRIPPWLFAERVMAEYQRLQAEQFRRKGLAVPKALGANIAFMTACDYDETSQTYEYYSLYMGFLIQGCGRASVDDNNDGEYQFSELHNYAAVHAVEINPNQHAQTYNPTLLQTTVARAVGSASGASFDTRNDYDGDRFSDLAVYNEAAGAWYIYSIKRGIMLATNIVFGGPGYHALTGDYDGDNKADLALYAEATGRWRIGSLARWALIAWDAAWGGAGLRPVAGDYNGDGYDDGALYEAANGYWYVATLFGRILVYGQSFAGAGFTAVPGDYNGDGISDYALYHNEMGYWYILSHAGAVITWGTYWGAAGYAPVSGDFDGDGKSDLALYSATTGLWYIWSLGRGRAVVSGLQYGGPGLIPVSGDYNGDRKADLALYDQSTGYWYIRTVDGAQQGVFNFGHPSFVPVKPNW